MNGGAIIDHIIEHGAHFALVDRDGIPAFETLGKVIQCVAVLYSRLKSNMFLKMFFGDFHAGCPFLRNDSIKDGSVRVMLTFRM
ncbi:hypothetical protein [Hyphomonas sp.]|uniref:hypothetical protein n=1 Tax=Hyphomonas sp. TaxID=87 RepID=UPI003002770E